MNEIKTWTYAPVLQGYDTHALVEEEDGKVRIDLKEPERLLAGVTMRMDKAVARALAVSIMTVVVSGCSLTGRYCDNTEIRAQYTHVSHPLAGAPFGPGTEEDAVHSIGPMGRCDMGRAYVEGGIGYKVRGSGFYGPDMTGTLNVGYTLWSSRR